MFRRILLSITVALSVSACEEENADRLKEDLSLHFVNETEESFREAKFYTGPNASSYEDFVKIDSIVLDLASKDEVSTTWNPRVNNGEGGFLLKLSDQRHERFGYYTRRTMMGYNRFDIVIKADTVEITQSK